MAKKIFSSKCIRGLILIFTAVLILNSISGSNVFASNRYLQTEAFDKGQDYSQDSSFEESKLVPESDFFTGSEDDEINTIENQKMDSHLVRLALAINETREAQVALAESLGLRVIEDKVQVHIITDQTHLEDAKISVIKNDGEIITVSLDGTILQAWLPIDRLAMITDSDSVFYLQQPNNFQSLENVRIGEKTTEGLYVMNGDSWHEAGFQGQGTKIAIIDSGFEGYVNLLGIELPETVNVKNFIDLETDEDINTKGGPHGLGCAEIIHDIAPQADLFFAKINNPERGLEEAVSWAISNEVDIISTSIGWFIETPGDGTGYLADLVQTAREAGILWITLAGNSRIQHWGGHFTSGPEGDYHYWDTGQTYNYFGPGDGTMALIEPGEEISVWLRWDDWTNVDQDYNLYLYRWDPLNKEWSQVDSSEHVQNGGENQKPREFVSTTSSGLAGYGFRIKRINSDRDVNFELFTNDFGQRLEEINPYRSLWNLADAPSAMTVAAVNVNAPYMQENYSSQGPTNGPGGAAAGGLTKPDISGYAKVSTVSMDTFLGTSAAAPHVAGAAGLVLSAFPEFSPDQLQTFLENRAIQMGAVEKDVIFGYGRLFLSDPPSLDLDVISPLQNNPAYAGSFINPRKIIVEVTKPAEGLPKDSFSITIGGSQADIVVLYESSEKYILEVIPPVVPQNDLYDLQVNINAWGNNLSATETNAINYANAASVDVALVIDRSGSMGGTPIESAKQAASQFVDFMNYGDMVGVISFSSDVTTDFPLTTITPPSTTAPVFSDDMESSTGKWTAQAPWGLTTSDYHSYSHSWTDSPGTLYANYLNISLQTSNTIHIPTTLSDPSVIFSHKYDLEEGYDWGYVEVSNNGGSTWTQLGGKFNGTNMTWHKGERSLASYSGQDILIRFRLTTDSSVVRDGWYIDDVIVGESGSNVKLLAKDAISYISATGMTTIGGGLQRGQFELTDRGDFNHPWAIILLTDGHENTSPYVADVLSDIVSSKTEVHTIGLGSANQAQLLDIATQTGGTFNYAPTPEELAGIYNTISGVVSNQQTLHSSTGTVASGATGIKQVVVDPSVSDATFSIIWSDSDSNINLTLKKPDGTFITPFFTFGDDYSEFVSGPNYQYYRIKQPTLTSGIWEIHVTDSTQATSIEKNIANRGDRAENYIARVTGNASLTAQFYLDKDSYFTDQPIKLIAMLSDTQPITNASVIATITPPSGFTQTLNESTWIEINGDTMPDPAYLSELKERVVEERATLQLFDDGQHGDGAANDGVYANYYDYANYPGTYIFSILAEGNSTTGDPFIRLANKSTIIRCRTFIPIIMSSGSSGFDSQFNGSAAGWETHSGIWNIDSNYFWTNGIIGSSSSVSYFENFGNFEYQVRMWRFGGNSDANRIIIRGTPNPLTTANCWNSSYLFQYTRDGLFSVWKMLSDGSSTALQNWAISSAINTGDAWNSLRVVANGNNLYFYINGMLVWSGSDSTLSLGRVGIGMYRSDDGIEDDRLYINWATLTTNISSSASFDLEDKVSAEQEIINEEANQILDINVNGTD
jgi:hypothetical protein